MKNKFLLKLSLSLYFLATLALLAELFNFSLVPVDEAHTTTEVVVLTANGFKQ